MDKIFQCVTNPRHVFATEPKQSLCPKCPSDEFAFVLARFKGEDGFEVLEDQLKKEKKPENKKDDLVKHLKNAEQYINENNFDEALKEYNLALGLNIDKAKVNTLIKEVKAAKQKYLDSLDKSKPTIPKIDNDEVGLGIILMDVSDSMNDPAFENAKITKLEMVAKSYAYGIFGLKNMTDPQFSFVHLYKFDHEVTPFLFDNIEHIWNRFGTPEEFEKYLLKEFSIRNGQTDINTTLQMAYSEANQFIAHNFKLLGNYKLKNHSVLLHNNDVDTIPNVRVLLYTDGLQYVSGKMEKLFNPFNNNKQNKYDFLIGAFIGNATSRGGKALEEVVGKCPKHNKKQFFLIDKPNKMKSFKNLFRMASGASGFCPDCMNDSHKDLRE